MAESRDSKESVSAPPPPEISIVTTALNEAGNVNLFIDGVIAALETLGVSGEILYFDDGSSDGTGDRVQERIDGGLPVPLRLIRHRSPKGMTAAMDAAFSLAEGTYVCLLPSDMESLPADDIPLLYKAMNKTTDVVVGWRQGREDGKLFASKVYNRLNRWLFNLNLKDANWIKLIRRDCLTGLRLRSDWHRYLLPILAHRGCRFKEVATAWNRRSYGNSKFGLKRFPVSLADMLTVKFLLSCGRRPLLFFLWTSSISFAFGLFFLFYCFIGDAAAYPGSRIFSEISSIVLLTTGLLSLGLGLVAEAFVDAGERAAGSKEKRS